MESCPTHPHVLLEGLFFERLEAGGRLELVAGAACAAGGATVARVGRPLAHHRPRVHVLQAKLQQHGNARVKLHSILMPEGLTPSQKHGSLAGNLVVMCRTMRLTKSTQDVTN
jgi:hypothetical protein